MSYSATITNPAQPDSMPLRKSPEQPIARAAEDIAEQHIYETPARRRSAPVGRVATTMSGQRLRFSQLVSARDTDALLDL